MLTSAISQATAVDDADEFAAHRDALLALQQAGYEPMVGGAYALRVHTGLWRDTKDLDLFLRKDRVEGALELLSRLGFRVEMTDPLWIAKAFRGEFFVDLIFSSGNGIAIVDGEWAQRAIHAQVLGCDALVVPVEEIIWSKAFVQERERFDGADIHHLLLSRGSELDWHHLLRRFAPHWQVLFSHLIMFRFAFPGARAQVPSWVMAELAGRVAAEEKAAPAPGANGLCRGALVSRQQYLHELNELGFRDARELEVAGWRGDSRWPVQPRPAPIEDGDDAHRSRG